LYFNGLTIFRAMIGETGCKEIRHRTLTRLAKTIQFIDFIILFHRGQARTGAPGPIVAPEQRDEVPAARANIIRRILAATP
jgi:hypothetical protein